MLKYIQLSPVVAILSAGFLSVSGCAPGIPESPSEASYVNDVIVHLFEWSWDDVATECESYLGPAGFSAVQVSQPVENSVVEGRPWWERYQPVSYQIEGRSGNRQQFEQMVARCTAAGVDIYVDAILNHMTGVYSGVGTAGSTFSEYDYPGLYDLEDFHHCNLTDGDDIQDWEDPSQVRNCELANLADLKTENPEVRTKLANYLRDFISMGVKGFRLDAARHVPVADITAILAEAGGDPFIYQEVVDMSPEGKWSRQYESIGTVTEFRYGAALGLIFRRGSMSNLYEGNSMWERTEYLPSDSVVVFLDNHDTQRHTGSNGPLTYRDESLYDLGQIFMLAFPYGRPRIMSSYEFDTPRQGPPSLDDESIKPVYTVDGLNCGLGEWLCEHRRPHVAAMVRFRAVTAPVFKVTNWWSSGRDRIAFSRGDLGFVAINRSQYNMSETLRTGLPEGSYCNVLTGDEPMGVCTGASFEVDSRGRATIAVAPRSAVALHVEVNN